LEKILIKKRRSMPGDEHLSQHINSLLLILIYRQKIYKHNVTLQINYINPL